MEQERQKKYISCLSDGDIVLRDDFGKKINHLALLKNRGKKVPDGFAVSRNAYDEFISHRRKQIAKIIRSHPPSRASEEIFNLFLEAKFWRRLSGELEAHIKQFDANTSFAVRSSGIVYSYGLKLKEDSDSRALAGQYETYLKVPPSMVNVAIRKCWASLFNVRSLKAFNSVLDSSYLDSSMSVLVQRMVQAERSAVVMTLDPCEERRVIGIESTYGPCEGLVAGVVEGDLFQVCRERMKITGKSMGAKLASVEHFCFDPQNQAGFNLVSNEPKLRNEYSLSETMIGRIAKLALELESVFGAPQDIECAIADGDIFVLQSRNITTFVSRSQS